jgi:hypothetical protein
MNLPARFPALFRFLVASAWFMGASLLDGQTLVINEFLASNQSTNFDEDNAASDWIELYNPGDEEIDLLGYSLSDKINQPAQWTFPAAKLGPRAYLLIWASGKNRKSSGALHTNFRLDASGEFLGLFTPDCQVADVEFPAAGKRRLYGRFPDGQQSYLS